MPEGRANPVRAGDQPGRNSPLRIDPMTAQAQQRRGADLILLRLVSELRIRRADRQGQLNLELLRRGVISSIGRRGRWRRSPGDDDDGLAGSGCARKPRGEWRLTMVAILLVVGLGHEGPCERWG